MLTLEWRIDHWDDSCSEAVTPTLSAIPYYTRGIINSIGCDDSDNDDGESDGHDVDGGGGFCDVLGDLNDSG